MIPPARRSAAAAEVLPVEAQRDQGSPAAFQRLLRDCACHYGPRSLNEPAGLRPAFNEDFAAAPDFLAQASGMHQRVSPSPSETIGVRSVTGNLAR